MGQVLMENAIEAWIAAVRYCKDIKKGKCTLQYRKSFVSALHNAVELFLKQMMLNNNDHRVATIKKVKGTDEAELLLEYHQAQYLNVFFEQKKDKVSRFVSAEFSDLIQWQKKMLKSYLPDGQSLTADLELLKTLRNNETHFLIQEGSFLIEREFCTLHNFMIRFYRILEIWHPENADVCERSFYPHWVSDTGKDSVYVFAEEPLQNFSYETAVRESVLTKEIAKFLAANNTCGAVEYSPYSIAKDLIVQRTEYVHRLDEVWAVDQKMLSFGFITIEEIQGQERIVCHI